MHWLSRLVRTTPYVRANLVMFLSLSFWLSLFLSVSLCLSLSVCLSEFMSVYLFPPLSVCLSLSLILQYQGYWWGHEHVHMNNIFDVPRLSGSGLSRFISSLLFCLSVRLFAYLSFKLSGKVTVSTVNIYYGEQILPGDHYRQPLYTLTLTLWPSMAERAKQTRSFCLGFKLLKLRFI